MTSLTALIKGIGVAITFLVMLILVIWAFLSLSGGDDGRGTADGGEQANTENGSNDGDEDGESVDIPPEPGVRVALGFEGDGTVTCIRPGGSDPSFVVEIDSAITEPVVLVAVDLFDDENQRSRRVATIENVQEGGLSSALVPDSADRQRWQACVVVAIQQGERVTRTGR